MVDLVGVHVLHIMLAQLLHGVLTTDVHFNSEPKFTKWSAIFKVKFDTLHFPSDLPYERGL